MKIKYMTEDGVLAVRNNAAVIAKRLISERHMTVQELLGNDNVIVETAFEINDFELDMSQEKGKEPLTDLENIKRVYNNMRNLSDSQASDERIWAAYTLSEEIDYMRYRWGTANAGNLLNRYLFSYSPQRSLFRNGVSRLWWIGRATYDSKRTDPYELAEFLITRDQDYSEAICGRNVFNNSEISKATVSALLDAEKDGIEIDRNLVREIGKYMNLLAGAYVLDVLDYAVIYDKASEKIRSIKVK